MLLCSCAVVIRPVRLVSVWRENCDQEIGMRAHVFQINAYCNNNGGRQMKLFAVKGKTTWICLVK